MQPKSCREHSNVAKSNLRLIEQSQWQNHVQGKDGPVQLLHDLVSFTL
jgi:hypothetical protein